MRAQDACLPRHHLVGHISRRSVICSILEGSGSLRCTPALILAPKQTDFAALRVKRPGSVPLCRHPPSISAQMHRSMPCNHVHTSASDLLHLMLFCMWLLTVASPRRLNVMRFACIIGLLDHCACKLVSTELPVGAA